MGPGHPFRVKRQESRPTLLILVHGHDVGSDYFLDMYSNVMVYLGDNALKEGKRKDSKKEV